jgi:signal transduction histidine kinase/DNA-binding response OmpR family regulator
LWIGSFGGGLMKYNRDTDDFSFYKNDPKDHNSLSSNSIASICEDKNGILWIGTNGSGLNRFDKKNNQIKRYREKDGLPNEIINGILSDDSGNLWMSTGKGISKFNIKSESFYNFDKYDGLQDNEFNAWAYFKDSSGRMYFGGINGFNSFHPDELSKNPNIPQIVITNLRILHKPVAIGYDAFLDRKVLEKSITETKVLELAYDENILSFEIAALDFHRPQKNKYAYILEGFDKQWIYADAFHRELTYTNLEPGKYILRVKGSNNDGVWNEAGVSLEINIHAPWWARWWAYLLYGFVITFIFGASTRFYLNREKLRNQLNLEHEHAIKLEEVDKMKSNFYANISHEFRTPLMLILGPLEKLATKLSDEESTKQVVRIRVNAKRLLNLINQLLDLARLEAKKLKLKASRGNIAQFVERLIKEFYSITEQRDISLKILMDKENITAYFDKEKLEKIITNVMSNAVKFTPNGGKITVRLAETPHRNVEIIVRDSGIGIPAVELNKIFDRFYQVDGSHTREHEGTGIGLALVKEFVELHRGQISIDSIEGHWTEVKLCFPLGKEHLKDEEIVETDEFIEEGIDDIEEFTRDELEAEECENNLVDKTIVLVVEDNHDLREYIKDDLKGIYHVEEAANGEQGLRKAEKLIPDLIVSDIMMPIMDGYELTRKLRGDEKTSHIPIILLTAKSDRESKLEGLGLGVDDYLTKPFDTQELLARIKNLIETRRLLQEKFGSGSVVLHKPEKAKLSFLDQQFLDRVMMVIDQHISEEEFSIEEFGKDVGMSRSQMHRKLKALTGKSTSLYLRTVRLAKAKQMIEQKRANISEISYQVGFSSPAYFSRCFKEEFGHSPSDVK